MPKSHFQGCLFIHNFGVLSTFPTLPKIPEIDCVKFAFVKFFFNITKIIYNAKKSMVETIVNYVHSLPENIWSAYQS